MPIVTGKIGPHGAILDVAVDVSDATAAELTRLQRPAPPPVFVKALIDTGANVSGFSSPVFQALGLVPVSQIPVLTASTPAHQPHLTDLFHVHLSIVANGSPRSFHDINVIVVDGWHPTEGATALIGRDILAFCYLNYHGLDGAFTLSF